MKAIMSSVVGIQVVISSGIFSVLEVGRLKVWLGVGLRGRKMNGEHRGPGDGDSERVLKYDKKGSRLSLLRRNERVGDSGGHW